MRINGEISQEANARGNALDMLTWELKIRW